MQLMYAFLAQAAQVMPDGTFSAFGGGLETLAGPAFPALVPSLTLVARLAVAEEEVNHEHRFRVDLFTPDGSRMQAETNGAPFTPQVGPYGPDLPVTHLFVADIPGLILPTAGEYQFRVIVDDMEVGRVLVYALTPKVGTKAPEAKEPEAMEA